MVNGAPRELVVLACWSVITATEYGEIDLVIEHEGELVAVEVKARDVDDLEQPEEAVTRWAKLRRIVRGSMSTYAMDNDLIGQSLAGRRGGDRVRPRRVRMLRLDHLRSVYPGEGALT